MMTVEPKEITNAIRQNVPLTAMLGLKLESQLKHKNKQWLKDERKANKLDIFRVPAKLELLFMMKQEHPCF